MERFLAEIGFYEWNVLQDAGRPLSEAVSDLCSRHPQYCNLIRAYDERYDESISGPIEGSVTILRRLHSLGHKLFGLSNWPAGKFQLMRKKYRFFDLFNEIIVSGEIRIAKPDPRIFDVLLAQVGIPASDCIFIDDALANITAAKSLGFQTIHFQSPEQLQVDLITMKILPTRID